MYKEYNINIFARVVKRRMKEEEKTAAEVLADYPKLTEQDIADIKTKL